VSELVLHVIPPAWGLPSIGPFCLKVEAHLRMVEVPYRSVVDATPFKGPKGKLPWIEHEGQRIGDSGFIVDYVTRRFGRDPDAALSAGARAVAAAFRRLLEENLYWTMVYDRWLVDANWPITKETVLGLIPAPARLLVAPVARRGVRRQLAGHGIGLHSRDEIHAIGCRDIGALADFLGEKPFLMGDAPTSIDAVAYGLLANIAWAPVASPVQDAIAQRPNLGTHLERMRARFFA
jgi:glutathione S-transferase